MVLDATDGECQEANFQIAPSTTTTRQWDIKVTQYACGEEDKAGTHWPSPVDLKLNIAHSG